VHNTAPRRHIIDSLAFLTVPVPQSFSDFILPGFVANNEMDGTRQGSTPHLSNEVTTEVQGRVYVKLVGMRRQKAQTEKRLE